MAGAHRSGNGMGMGLGEVEGPSHSGQLGCTITGGSQRYALKLNHYCVIQAPHTPSLGLGVPVEVRSSMLCKEVTLLEISPFLCSASGRGGDLSSRGWPEVGDRAKFRPLSQTSGTENAGELGLGDCGLCPQPTL